MSPRGWCATGLVAAVLLAAAPAAADVVMGQVTYLVGGSVYVDVGGLDGLAAGDTLDVVRGAARVGRLVARDVAPRRAACDTLAGSTGTTIAVGDGARFTPHAAIMTAGILPPAPSADSVAIGPTPTRARRVRGRLGVSAWSVRAGENRAFVEPAADAWVDARGLGGGALDAVLDVRGRGIAPAAGSLAVRESFGARVYRAALTWHDAGSRRLLTVGRQYAPNFASVSLFDGVIARSAGTRLGGGVLVGAQPRAGHLDPSLDVLQAGAFVEAHSGPGRAARWTATLGGVASWQEGETNRDFVFASGAWQARGVAFLLAQEADIARGWRSALLSAPITLTSTFASTRVEITPRVQARAGYDGRRSVPLYRDRATPETEFDDARREGAWLGASAQPARAVRLDADVRQRFGSAAERMTTWNGGFEITVAGVRSLRVRGRAARARGETLRTMLASGGIECDVAPGLSLGVAGGVRTTTDARVEFADRAPWWSAEGDWAFASGWSVAGSFERESGDPTGVSLGRLGAAWRF